MKVLIIGATSGIAEALARRYADRGAQLVLAARDLRRLESIAADARVRGARDAHVLRFEATAIEEQEAFLDEAWRLLSGIDVIVIAYGTLSDQKKCSSDRAELLRELQINCVSVIALSESCANRLEAQRHGSLAVLSSVAGDRGRASNYAYGAAKAAVTTFCSGLRQRLVAAGVHVLTVKPGFVDTPMTAHFAKGALWASAAKVAADIDKAITKRKTVLYTPGFWRLIMFVVKNVPETIFAKFGPR
jgi:decaprenylphospho-beta-D-erythro-pentofuranosid-2-ulose 2-reductase